MTQLVGSSVSEVLFNAGSTPWGMAPGQVPGQHHPGMPVPPPGMPHAALHYPPPAHPAAMAPPPGVHPPYHTLSFQESNQGVSTSSARHRKCRTQCKGSHLEDCSQAA